MKRAGAVAFAFASTGLGFLGQYEKRARLRAHPRYLSPAVGCRRGWLQDLAMPVRASLLTYLRGGCLGTARTFLGHRPRKYGSSPDFGASRNLAGYLDMNVR